MYQDFKDLLSAFHAHSVKYLIVGGPQDAKKQLPETKPSGPIR
jgi:hypothetical protein